MLPFLFTCTSQADVHESSELSVQSEELDILETCRRNIGIASPDTLRAAMQMLSESDAGRSEAGREYYYIAARLMELVYPIVSSEQTAPDAPAGSIYPGIFESVKNGRYPEVQNDKISFFSVLISPVTVLFSQDKTVEILSSDNLEQAISMNSRSVLPVFLSGYISERNNLYDEAILSYSRALEMDPSCYPAELGTARVYMATGREDLAADLMDMLTAQYPYSAVILKTAAETRFSIGDYTGALDFSSDVLRLLPDNPEILLLRAEIFQKQKNTQQALRLIEVLQRMRYTPAEFYTVKSEVEKAQGALQSAINTLQEGLKKYPDSKELKAGYGTALILAGRKDEARELLGGTDEAADTESLIVLIDDAVKSRDWDAAFGYAEQLEAQKMDVRSGRAAWNAWYKGGNTEKALNISQQLYSEYPADIDASIMYIRSLLSLNRRLQAERILETALPAVTDSANKSELLYLQSLTLDNEDEKLQSLRAALFEDLQNTDALVEIADLYVEMGDVRKGYRYIKQAAAILPDDPDIAAELQRIEGLLQ